MVEATRSLMYCLFSLAILKLVFNVDVPVVEWYGQAQSFVQDKIQWNQQTYNPSLQSLDGSVPQSSNSPSNRSIDTDAIAEQAKGE